MKFRNPLFATAALLLAGSAFAAIIVVSYPDNSGPKEDVPVVRAENTAFKENPDDPGGMEIPFQDSTIFASMHNGQAGNEGPPVENLLASVQEEEEPVDPFVAFAKEAERVLEVDITEDVVGVDSSDIDSDTRSFAVAEEREVEEPVATPVEIKKIARKTEKVSGQELAEANSAGERSDAANTQRPYRLHAPGSSPDTLAFVRSVLDKKDERGEPVSSAVAEAEIEQEEEVDNSPVETFANVEPAAGAATVSDIRPGSYFVQLASVTSSSGAAVEWGKMVSGRYSDLLQDVSYRVQEANLGERGTFYRIQAGPMSKDSADSLCNAIKERNPGGCLVVK